LKGIKHIIAGACVLVAAGVAGAGDLKVGVVRTDLLERDFPMTATQKKEQGELAKRDQELKKELAQLKLMSENLEKDGLTMAENERKQKERDLFVADQQFKTKARLFQEDLNAWRAANIDKNRAQVMKVIAKIAETEKFDLILQDAIYVGPKLDITDKVIKALTDSAGK
jgi:outer membrane protein